MNKFISFKEAKELDRIEKKREAALMQEPEFNRMFTKIINKWIHHLKMQ